MTFKDPLQLLTVLCLGVGLCACRGSQLDARQSVQTELATRRSHTSKSMDLFRQGSAAYYAGDCARARGQLEAALAKDERNVCAWMIMGAVEWEQGKLFEAAQAFHRASRLAPERYEPHFNLGIVLESAGQYEQAISEYKIALHHRPGQLHVMENLARCYVRTKSKLPEAQDLIRRALQIEQRPEWKRWLEEQSLELTLAENEQRSGPNALAKDPAK